jgi:hypothetical protein
VIHAFYQQQVVIKKCSSEHDTPDDLACGQVADGRHSSMENTGRQELVSSRLQMLGTHIALEGLFRATRNPRSNVYEASFSIV